MELQAATLDITPSATASLGGMGASRESHGVGEPIEVNILALRESPVSQPLFVVSIDVLYPGRQLRRVIDRELSRIPSARIFLAGSHTHTAPMTDDTKPRLGRFDENFTADVSSRICATLKRMCLDEMWEPVALEAGSAQADHSINRRRWKRLVIAKNPRITTVVNAPNPSGERDELVTCLVGRDENGTPSFVVWNYACHPVAYPNSRLIAANFPGAVRDRLRAELGSERLLPVLYLQGFSGNTRPSASAKLRGWERRLRRVIVGPIFSDMSWRTYRSWSASLGERVLTSIGNASPLQSVELSAARRLVQSENFVEAAPDSDVAFHALRIGDDFCIAGVSAEAVAEYGPMVRKAAGSPIVMCVGCIDHVVGYVPTTQILQEGGYEAGGFCAEFGLGPVAHDVQSAFVDSFDAVLSASRDQDAKI